MTDSEYQIYIETCPEVELYSVINFIGGAIWRINHDMADGRIPREEHASLDKSLSKDRKRLEKAVDQCTRFGVAMPRRSDGCGSDDYWRWFRWWDAWAKALSNEDFAEMGENMSTKRDLTKWRPKGDWRHVAPNQAVRL